MPTVKKTKRNSPASSIIIAIGLVMIVAGTYSYFTSKNNVLQPVAELEPTPVIEPVKVPQPAAAITETVTPPLLVAAEPEVIVEPTPEVEPAIKLPPLDESDTMALQSAQQLSSLATYSPLLIKTDIIRNFVVFTDNFARGDLLANFSPLIKPADKFSVLKRDNKIYLNEESYNRYAPYVEIINSIDIEFMISQYTKLKPLFDQAYQEIGYPEGAFGSTLIEAIDTALDAPVIREPIALVAPSAMYKFADPELETLADAQKLMIRMGPDNMLKLQEKLQEIQSALLAISEQ